ncbi:hypothetical protein SAMN05444339_10240 [Loktanella atrilutea]|uniref:Uncharacterized protein n=1 Tax=Loktanella atrilutea TaxID=366533 RepID=A0A1M4WAI3_LOKAT|nr:hypothetical protein [Loktanella atrilutea]SHE77972.1 hypothetical protein SAMN05444339_10240 [Loktanella atrilutea]
MPDGSHSPVKQTLVVDQVFGANKAPVAEVLAADFDDLLAEIEKTCSDAKDGAPAKVTTEADLITAGRHVTALGALSKRIDAARAEQKRPITDTGRAIDSFFRIAEDRVAAAALPIRRAADEHARRVAAEERERQRRVQEDAKRKAEAAQARADNAKSEGAAARAAAEAEAQSAIADGATANKAAPVRAEGVTASARTSWDFAIDDNGALRATLGQLGPFLDDAAIEKAVRAIVRIHKGNTSLPGVRVFESTKATFRS